MTSKERVRAAIQRKEPDRVPASMQCVETAWENLKKAFGTEDTDRIMEQLEIDIRIMDLPPYKGPELPVFRHSGGETEYTHPFGYRYINKWNGVEYNMHVVHFPLKGIETADQLNRYFQWPNPDHYDYEAVKRFCDKHSDRALRIGWPGPYQAFTYLYPAEDFYLQMAEEPELVHAMLDRFAQFYLELYERMLEAGDGAIDILRCCDDYGTQKSLLFSPAMWDEFFAENTRKLADLAHRYNCFYMQHSCGSVCRIIPNLIACGVDILEPVQKVEGMEVDGLKADFGGRIAFQGGVDTQKLLPLGKPEEVQREAEYIIETMNRGGGYILAPSQDFEGDVPVENILALYEARKKFL